MKQCSSNFQVISLVHACTQSSHSECINMYHNHPQQWLFTLFIVTVLLEYIGSKFLQFHIVYQIDMVETIIPPNRAVTDLLGRIDLVVILFTLFIIIINIIALSCDLPLHIPQWLWYIPCYLKLIIFRRSDHNVFIIVYHVIVLIIIPTMLVLTCMQSSYWEYSINVHYDHPKLY